MFERFTDRARRTLVLAQEEARNLGHNFIGTEHILLGLALEGEGVAAKALAARGITTDAIREKVRETIGPGAEPVTGQPPFTPRSKKVLELSLREALQLGHNYIGTEHLLLGLIREGEGVAAQVLVTLGAGLDDTRQAVIDILMRYTTGAAANAPAAANREFSPAVKTALQMVASMTPEGEVVTSGRLLLGLALQVESQASKILVEQLNVDLSVLAQLVQSTPVDDTSDEDPEARLVELRIGRRVVKLGPALARRLRGFDDEQLARLIAGIEGSAVSETLTAARQVVDEIAATRATPPEKTPAKKAAAKRAAAKKTPAKRGAAKKAPAKKATKKQG